MARLDGCVRVLRNWADKTKCHKCHVAKGACYLRNAPGTDGPSVSSRNGKGGRGGEEVALLVVGNCKQEFQKLFDSLQDPSVRARQAEEKAAEKARIKELEAQLAEDGEAA